LIESDKTIIEAKDLTRCFKVSNADTMLEYIAQIFTHKKEVKYAVKAMSFTIEKGETVALLGVNGAGKSTLIKMMAGILVPSSGEIKVFGRDPFKKRKENCRKIGAVFGQRTQLRWDLSPLEYYKLIKAVYDIKDCDFNQRLEEMSNALEAKDFLKQSVRTLSLGQRMRAELIASFLHSPELVFLDEPTIGLDVFSKDAIINFLSEYRKRKETTLILVTHDMEDVKRICERAIIISAGEKIIDSKILDLEKRENEEFKDVFLKLCKAG